MNTENYPYFPQFRHELNEEKNDLTFYSTIRLCKRGIWYELIEKSSYKSLKEPFSEEGILKMCNRFLKDSYQKMLVGDFNTSVGMPNKADLQISEEQRLMQETQHLYSNAK